MLDNVIRDLYDVMLEHATPKGFKYYMKTQTATELEEKLIDTFTDEQNELFEKMRKAEGFCRDKDNMELIVLTVKTLLKILY